MAQDYFNTGFGTPSSDSTGAPGGGSPNLLAPGSDSTTSVSQAGHQLTSDLSPVSQAGHHSLPENAYHEVDQSGLPHGGVEAANGSHPLAGEFTNQTGAGSGSIGHSHGR